MFKFGVIAAAAALATCSAQPALANDFGGVYVQGTVGVEDLRGTDVVYGANAGVNVPVGDMIVGVEATLDNVFQDEREIGASARLGYAPGPVMVYTEIGYTNYRDVFSRELDGLRVGGGLEYNISDNTFVSIEGRYTDFDGSAAGKYAVIGGLGVRF